MPSGRLLAGMLAAVALAGIAAAPAAAQDRLQSAYSCFSIPSLAKSISSESGYPLAVTQLIGGNQARIWARAVARKTGSPLQADEVAVAKGRGIAPLVMLIFAREGCARNIVMVRILPDPEI